MHRIHALFLLLMTSVGCYAATKSTVDLTGAQQQLELARAAGAPQQATYAWTMADEYLKKARDEWSRSDYEAADSMIKKALHWAKQAESIAKASGWSDQDSELQDAPIEEASGEPETTTQEGVWQ